MEYLTIGELLKKAKEAEGKTFLEIDKRGRVATGSNKGSLGQIIEESLFEYEVNNEARPDFENLGVELKVTPVKINRNKSISAKERLVLNIINYMDEYSKSFEESSFWSKNENILMMFYLWQPQQNYEEYRILKSELFSYPEKDLEIIKNDWAIIVNKIRNGKAHDISEGDTMYLGACTKGANKYSLRAQPFSEIPAKQRAYSLKQSYMTTLVRKIFNNEKLIQFASATDLKGKTIDEIIQDRFAPYIGMEIKEISESVGYTINPSNKSTIANLISSILGISGTSLDDIEEFSKSNIQFKTVRLEPDGMPKEHMSFEKIDFKHWLDSDWEESQLYRKFELTKFLFIVFEYTEDVGSNGERKLFFKGTGLWNMPEQTIQNELKELWIEVKKILRDGVVLNQVKRGIQNNLPGSNFNGITHIRPKARNGSDKVRLPDGQMITKQSYWLNREYIAGVINNLIMEGENGK